MYVLLHRKLVATPEAHRQAWPDTSTDERYIIGARQKAVAPDAGVDAPNVSATVGQVVLTIFEAARLMTALVIRR